MKYDPTKSKTLIRSYETALKRRISRFWQYVRKPLLEALKEPHAYLKQSSGKISVHNTALTDIGRLLDEYDGYFLRPKLKTAIDRYMKQAYTKGAVKAGTDLTYLRIAFSFEPYPVDFEAVNVLIDNNFSLVTNANHHMKKEMLRHISNGILEGKGIYKIQKDLRSTIKMTKVRATMIARTEVINAYNNAARNQYKKVGVKKWKWITTYDDRTCFPGNIKIKTNHGEKSIKKIKKGDMVLTRDGYKPVMETMKKKYNGNMVKIKTSIHDLVCTGNHPLFVIGKGWLSAEKVNINDVLQTFDNKTGKITDFVNFPLAKPNNRPTVFIQESSLSGIPFRVIMPISTVNLNSDLSIENNKINTIPSDLNFLFEGNPNICKGNTEFLFDGSFPNEFSVTRKRTEPFICFSRTFSKLLPACFTFDNNGWSTTQFGAIDSAMSGMIIEDFTTSFAFDVSSASQSAFDTTNSISVSNTFSNCKLFSTNRTYLSNHRSGMNHIVTFPGAVDSFIRWRNKFFLAMRTYFSNQFQHLTFLDKISLMLYGAISIYNLQVKDKPEYYANGILVHNCDFCSSMDGTIHSMNESMPPIASHCQCRCTVAPIVERPK